MVSRCVQIALVVFTTILLLLTLAVNYLSTSELGYKIGLFAQDTGIPWTQRRNLTRSSLTPPGWAFSVWGVIYLCQVAMLAYCWSLLFRWHEGKALCCIPGLLPVGFLLAYWVSCVFNITWIFLADRVDGNETLLIPLTIVLFLTTAPLWICLAVSSKQLQRNGLQLQRVGLAKEYWLVIALVHNAIGLYVGWTSIACFLNVDLAIVNLTEYTADSSSLLCLCQICLLLGLYVAADFSFLDAYLRFVFAPYVTMLWALATSVAGNYRAGSAKSDVSVQLAALLCALLVAKVLSAIVRQKRNPLPDQQRSGFGERLTNSDTV